MSNIVVCRKKGMHYQLGAIAATLLLTLPAGLSAAEEGAAGRMPEKITINIQASCPQIAEVGPDKKEVKDFSHRLHAEKYLPGKSTYAPRPYRDDFTCVACHAGAQSKEGLIAADQCERLTAAIQAGGGPKNYKQTMHAICQDCHKKMQQAGEKTTGPTKCAECHGK